MINVEEGEFLILSQLFDSIGIVEKGIERIYDYLLRNKKIENLNEVCEQNGLSLKRGYKICSVLNDLNLVQIYDRPMKIFLQTEVVARWQELINLRIEKLQKEFQEQKEKCELNLEEFLKNYDLKEKEIQEPVEFYGLNIPNFSEILRNYKVASSECRIAIGIHYENPLISLIKKEQKDDIQKLLKNEILPEILSVEPNLRKLNVILVLNEELFIELINSSEYALLNELINSMDLKVNKIDARITNVNFSNFSLTDDELIQPSFDPTNQLIGCYISRNKNIYQIFSDKFNEISKNGISLKDFVKQNKSIPLDSISEKTFLTLSLL